MRSAITLSLHQLVEIEHAVASDRRPGVRQRAAAIRLLHLGSTPAQAAIQLGCTAKTVRLWCQRFLDEGVEGLADRPRSGRPLKGDAHYQRVLKETLACDPEDLGLWFRSWTVPRLRDYLEYQTDIILSDGRMRALLKRLGYHYAYYTRRTPNPNPPSLKGWQGTSLEGLVKALLAVRREDLWGWRKQPAG